jgi:hypothetical protein
MTHTWALVVQDSQLGALPQPNLTPNTNAFEFTVLEFRYHMRWV